MIELTREQLYIIISALKSYEISIKFLNISDAELHGTWAHA